MEQVNRDAQWPYCLYLYLYGYLFNQQTYLSLCLYLDRKSGRRHGLDMWNTSHTHTHTHTHHYTTSPTHLHTPLHTSTHHYTPPHTPTPPPHPTTHLHKTY